MKDPSSSSSSMTPLRSPLRRPSSPSHSGSHSSSTRRRSTQFVLMLLGIAIVMLLMVQQQQTAQQQALRNHGMTDHVSKVEEEEQAGETIALFQTQLGDEAVELVDDEEDDDDKDDDDESLEDEPLGRTIKQISILGERNSGTRWTYSHLLKCFSHSKGIKVHRRLTRYKHWFQNRNDTAYPHDTLVVAQFRNPYDWLKAMEHVPHHSPAHLRTAKANFEDNSAQNHWKTFLTKPWTMPRIGKDLELKGDEMCQHNFHYRDIVSCVAEPIPASEYNHTIRYSEHQPFYEMRNDGSGEPYANILELRTDKIRNFLSTIDFPGVADLWVVQYEYLLQNGTADLIRRISEVTGVEPRCDPYPPQVRPRKWTRRITKPFADHIDKYLNWTVEEMIGYRKWQRK